MEKTESRYLERTDDVWTRLRLADCSPWKWTFRMTQRHRNQMLEEIKKKISERT